MAASKIDEVTTALVSLFTTAVTANTDVVVSDGPPTSMSAPGTWVLVGDDGDPDSDARSVFEQTWVDLACTRRQELGDIVCGVVTQSGSTDLAGVRGVGGPVLDTLAAALLTDLSLGGVVMTAQLAGGQAIPLQNSAGSAVVTPFTVSYRVHV